MVLKIISPGCGIRAFLMLFSVSLVLAPTLPYLVILVSLNVTGSFLSIVGRMTPVTERKQELHLGNPRTFYSGLTSQSSSIYTKKKKSVGIFFYYEEIPVKILSLRH